MCCVLYVVQGFELLEYVLGIQSECYKCLVGLINSHKRLSIERFF